MGALGGRPPRATWPAAYVPGPSGQALALTNPDSATGGDCVSIPYELTDAGTIALWCNPGEYHDFQTLFANSANVNDWEMWIDSNGTAEFRIENGAEVGVALPGLGEADEWYHFAMTWLKTGEEVVLNLYVNGLLRDVDQGDWTDPGDTVFLGGGKDNEFGSVGLDDFRIYDTVLNSDEIVAVYLGLTGLEGDLDGDGFVGGGDLDIIRSHWGEIVSLGDRDSGDLDGDGFIGGNDLDVIRAHWGQTRETLLVAQVPEPGAALLAISAMLAMIGKRGWRNRRKGI